MASCFSGSSMRSSIARASHAARSAVADAPREVSFELHEEPAPRDDGEERGVARLPLAERDEPVPLRSVDGDGAPVDRAARPVAPFRRVSVGERHVRNRDVLVPLAFRAALAPPRDVPRERRPAPLRELAVTPLNAIDVVRLRPHEGERRDGEVRAHRADPRGGDVLPVELVVNVVAGEACGHGRVGRGLVSGGDPVAREEVFRGAVGEPGFVGACCARIGGVVRGHCRVDARRPCRDRRGRGGGARARDGRGGG